MSAKEARIYLDGIRPLKREWALEHRRALDRILNKDVKAADELPKPRVASPGGAGTWRDKVHTTQTMQKPKRAKKDELGSIPGPSEDPTPPIEE